MSESDNFGMQEWSSAVSRRAWSRQLPSNKQAPLASRRQQFNVGENEDYEDEDVVYWFVGLRGGLYRYTKIKSS
jgi:hypothetical protein